MTAKKASVLTWLYDIFTLLLFLGWTIGIDYLLISGSHDGGKYLSFTVLLLLGLVLLSVRVLVRAGKNLPLYRKVPATHPLKALLTALLHALSISILPFLYWVVRFLVFMLQGVNDWMQFRMDLMWFFAFWRWCFGPILVILIPIFLIASIIRKKALSE
jgi:hypothetical protein